jgi:signal peptidase II
MPRGSSLPGNRLAKRLRVILALYRFYIWWWWLLPFISIRRDRRAPLVLFSTAFAVLAADQATKEWVRHSLQLGEAIPEHGCLRLIHSSNTGIIFGIGAPTVFSIIMPIVLVCAALLVYYWYGPIANRLANVCVGLFVGGTMGNLVDRLRFRAVTDFVDVRLWGDMHWFTFNLADVGIISAILLFAVLISGMRLTRGIKRQ